MPWLTICRIEPLMPLRVDAEDAEHHEAEWLTELYATSFFTSRCTHAQYAP